ncbi:MAG: helix-turn-helix domain-containing protein [Acidobacteriota bacterium]|nr:helix-turn-helix domain-containing protein [Acidobacteriota bacterium]
MNFNATKYGELLTAAIPRVIESDAEYDRLEAIFESLLDKGEDGRSPEEDALFDLLANLMEDYERRTLEPLPASPPREILRFLMEENGLKQKDLAEIFGGQSVVSDVLNGKREINKDQAKKLGERFSLSPAAFI